MRRRDPVSCVPYKRLLGCGHGHFVVPLGWPQPRLSDFLGLQGAAATRRLVSWADGMDRLQQRPSWQARARLRVCVTCSISIPRPRLARACVFICVCSASLSMSRLNSSCECSAFLFRSRLHCSCMCAPLPRHALYCLCAQQPPLPRPELEIAPTLEVCGVTRHMPPPVRAGHMPALRITGLRNCKVVAGPVTGATFMDDVQGCTFALASYQVCGCAGQALSSSVVAQMMYSAAQLRWPPITPMPARFKCACSAWMQVPLVCVVRWGPTSGARARPTVASTSSCICAPIRACVLLHILHPLHECSR